MTIAGLPGAAEPGKSASKYTIWHSVIFRLLIDIPLSKAADNSADVQKFRTSVIIVSRTVDNLSNRFTSVDPTANKYAERVCAGKKLPHHFLKGSWRWNASCGN